VGRFICDFDQWATAKEFPPHLATIVPAAAAHPGLDYPSYNIRMTYDVQWFTLTSGDTRRIVVWRSEILARKILDACKQHLLSNRSIRSSKIW
jgi:hypothetical protein